MPKVEIQVAGHCVSVESTDSLSEVTRTALKIYKRTVTEAKNLSLGFSSNGTITHVPELAQEVSNGRAY